jgi:hypothetical protein
MRGKHIRIISTLVLGLVQLGFQRRKNFIEHFFSITKKHSIVFFIKKWIVHTGIGFYLLSTACSQSHKDPSPPPTADKNTLLKEGAYSYPHPSQWNVEHVEFYAKFGKQIQGSSQDCLRCHTKNDLIGTPKNVSCAVKCHTPVSKVVDTQPVGSIGALLYTFMARICIGVLNGEVSLSTK